MRMILQTISWIALAATVVPPLLFLTNAMGLDEVKLAMLVAAVVWFVVTPLWMGRQSGDMA